LCTELEHTHPKLAELKAENEQLKKALRQSEERFFKIFHASSNPMAITTVEEGRIVDLNEADARMGGFTREELIGHTITELDLLADPNQRNMLNKRLEEKGKVHNLEMEVRTKTGDMRTVLLSLDPITVNDEACALGFVVDITERKKESDALRESEEKYRTLVENSLQGLAIMQDSRFVFCNRRLAEIAGYSVEEILSLSEEEMIKMIHPDDRKFIEDRRLDRMAGKPVPARYEFRGIKKDGTEIWLEICSSLIEYNGRPAIQSAFMDISDAKKAARELQSALDWQQAIFEGSRDAIMISDVDTRFIDVNEAACKLTGYSKQELLNMGALDLNKTLDPLELERLSHRILGGEDILGESEIFTKDGRRIDVEFSHRSVIISGEPYLHSVARDVTNRKRLEAQFLQAQKMEAIGVLAGGIAHDFNNLLNVINGYSELITDELPEDDPIRRDLKQISEAGRRAATLIAQLLAFSREQMLQPEILNLNETVTQMSTMLRRLIGEDIKLEAITQADLGLIHADPVQVQQIIMNLAVNARDAMPQGGKLTIETANVDLDASYIHEHPIARPGPYVMMAISDNGTGIDAATQVRIFEPFFTTKEKGKGTGLGLSTVYGIVKQSKGFIWVYSELAKGTTFKIYFPRIEGELAKREDDKELAPGFGGSETVLVVEDDASVRNLVCRILKDLGYRVLEAGEGKEALRLAQEHEGKIHLILTDAVMPGMGGKELVSQMEALRPGTKSLYVSGYTNKTIVQHGIVDASVAFLQKPFTIESLARKVREVLNS
jgi:PAS domain S-box-containing protein